MDEQASETNITDCKGYRQNIYTDLALEMAEEAGKEGEVRGVRVSAESDEYCTVTWVTVENDEGVKNIGKPVGNYVTVESAELREHNADAHESIIETLADCLKKLVKLDEKSSILVVGLGNRMVTPDALGPRTAGKVLVTRHIMNTLPEEAEGTARPVAVISPGVMGTTGVETRDIIKGVCDHVKPDAVIVIDALAARAVSRVNATIQIADTGLTPGAGMSDGGKRAGVNKDFLGCQVIAIGVPTVVDAATLVNDTLDIALQSMIEESEEGAPFYKMLQNLRSNEKYAMVRRLLEPYSGNMFVTPKEVDEVIDRLSNIIANALNITAHPGMTIEDINRYMY